MKIESSGNVYYPDRILKVTFIDDEYRGSSDPSIWTFYVTIVIGGVVDNIRFRFKSKEEAEKERERIIALADKQV